MVRLYGIKNCDTIKKARKWLSDHHVEYTFCDVRIDGIDATAIEHWIAQAGWEKVLNRSGTTWRKLPEDVRETTQANNVVALLLDHPAMIKRPVLDVNGTIHIGFKPDLYETIFH